MTPELSFPLLSTAIAQLVAAGAHSAVPNPPLGGVPPGGRWPYVFTATVVQFQGLGLATADVMGVWHKYENQDGTYIVDKGIRHEDARPCRDGLQHFCQQFVIGLTMPAGTPGNGGDFHFVSTTGVFGGPRPGIVEVLFDVHVLAVQISHLA